MRLEKLTPLFLCILLRLLPSKGEVLSDSLTLKITKEVVSIHKGSQELRFDIILGNRTDTNFILYGFRKVLILDSSIDSIFFNDIIINGGAGSVLILLNKNGSRQEIHPEVCFDCGQQNKEEYRNPDYLSIAKMQAKDIYSRTKEFLKGNSYRVITLEFSLTNVELDCGEYYLYIIYYCGSDLYDIVDKKTTDRDEKKLRGKVFHGWLKSNTVKLIVEQ